MSSAICQTNKLTIDDRSLLECDTATAATHVHGSTRIRMESLRFVRRVCCLDVCLFLSITVL